MSENNIVQCSLTVILSALRWGFPGYCCPHWEPRVPVSILDAREMKVGWFFDLCRLGSDSPQLA